MFVTRVGACRAGLLAFACLLALAASAALFPSRSALAAPPDDLELILSLVDDSDNVVPPDSTLKVKAQLRHTGIEHNLQISAGTLRISGIADWEETGRSTLPINQQMVGAAAWRGSEAMFGDRYGGGALSENTLAVNSVKSVYHDHDNDPATMRIWEQQGGKFYVYNAQTKTQIAQINPPTGASENGFANTVLVHQASGANTATIFVTSPQDSVTISSTLEANVGRLYIYTVNYAVTPPTVTLSATITPSDDDAIHFRRDPPQAGDKLPAKFGTTAALSGDGSILVVGAPQLHRLGGAIVFHRPATGWNALTWADGAQLSPMKIVDDAKYYESSANGGYTGAERTKANSIGWTETGGRVGISRDGSTIAFGGFNRTRNDTNTNLCTGTRSSTDNRTNTACGWIAVFEKPSGNWATDDSPDAELFHDGMVHVQRLGQWLALNHDGSVIAGVASQRQPARTSPGYVYLFNEPAGTWNGAITSAHARLEVAGGKLGDVFGQGGVSFNVDGTKLAVSNSNYQDATGAGLAKGAPNTSNFYGRAWIFDKPSGAWANATTANATLVEAPSKRVSAFFGGVRYAADGERLLVGQSERSSYYSREIGPGAMWLFDASLEPVFFAGSACEISAGESVNDSSDDINTCPLATAEDATIVIPPGFDDGRFVISGRVTIEEQVYRSTLEVRVAEIQEVAKATLEIGTDSRGTPATSDDRPHKSALEPGESTVLRLAVLNENDAASGPNTIASILITATSGSLSTNINDNEGRATTDPMVRANQDGCIGTGGLACQVRVAALDVSNSDKIDITLRAPSPARPGIARVRAVVLSRDGESLATETIEIAFTGLPQTYAISMPTTSVLNEGTDDDSSVPDNRDRLLLAATAADASGNKVALPGTELDTATQLRMIPSHRLTIISPAGRRNPTGVAARWLAEGGGLKLNRAGEAQIEIDVDAEPTARLANGEYTIEMRVGAKTARQTFVVSGGPATLTLGEVEGTLGVSESVMLTATIADSEGNPVPDDTRVVWLDRPTGATPVTVQLSAQTRTRDGRATANYLVIGPGSGYVTATADTATDIRLLRVDDSALAQPLMVAEALTSTSPGGFSTWLDDRVIDASELLAAVDGVDSVLLWENGVWLRYGTSGDLVIPGSLNFRIRLGAVLWLGN